MKPHTPYLNGWLYDFIREKVITAGRGKSTTGVKTVCCVLLSLPADLMLSCYTAVDAQKDNLSLFITFYVVVKVRPTGMRECCVKQLTLTSAFLILRVYPEMGVAKAARTRSVRFPVFGVDSNLSPTDTLHLLYIKTG